MKELAKISVIVPVYNTGKYLKRCLETIVNQSYKNIEVIVVDDASTDDSPAIITQFLNMYDFVQYYRLPSNGGVGNARNIGISYATGDYIGFVDSDDWIDSNFYATLISNVENNNADIGICGIKTEYNNFQSSKMRYLYMYENVIDNIYALHSLTNEYAHDIKISPIINNKIYKTSLITKNKILFDSQKRSQDNYFSFFMLIYARKIAIVPDTFYHYYQRNGSATHDFSKKYIDDYFYILKSIYDSLKERNLINIYKTEYISYVNRCIHGLFKNLFDNEQQDEIQKNYIYYILKKCSEIIPAKDIINYIDTVRFKRYLGL